MIVGVAAIAGLAIAASLAPILHPAAALLAGALCGGVLAAFGLAGRSVLAWLRDRPILAAALLGLTAYSVLLSLRIFTPLEDAVVGVVAGSALAALITCETGGTPVRAGVSPRRTGAQT